MKTATLSAILFGSASAQGTIPAPQQVVPMDNGLTLDYDDDDDGHVLGMGMMGDDGGYGGVLLAPPRSGPPSNVPPGPVASAKTIDGVTFADDKAELLCVDNYDEAGCKNLANELYASEQNTPTWPYGCVKQEEKYYFNRVPSETLPNGIQSVACHSEELREPVQPNSDLSNDLCGDHQWTAEQEKQVNWCKKEAEARSFRFAEVNYGSGYPYGCSVTNPTGSRNVYFNTNKNVLELKPSLNQKMICPIKPTTTPMKGVDGTFVKDKTTNTWVPTTKTWEDMATCRDLGFDDSCLTPKSKCNMRHNVDKTGKGPKYLFDAGEECCCGNLEVATRPPIFSHPCMIRDCANWMCKDWCWCEEHMPWMVTFFDAGVANEYCPSDGKECNCDEEEEGPSGGGPTGPIEEIPLDIHKPWEWIDPLWDPLPYIEAIMPPIICGDWGPTDEELEDLMTLFGEKMLSTKYVGTRPSMVNYFTSFFLQDVKHFGAGSDRLREQVFHQAFLPQSIEDGQVRVFPECG